MVYTPLAATDLSAVADHKQQMSGEICGVGKRWGKAEQGQAGGLP